MMNSRIPRHQVKCDTTLSIDEFIFVKIVLSPSDQMNPDEVIIGFANVCDSFDSRFSDFLRAELQRYHFTVLPGNRLLNTCMEKESQRSITENRSSQLDYNYHYNQNKRKKIMRRLSSFLVSTIVSLAILFNISSQFSVNQVQPLHKEHHDRLSIWPSLLGLFCFMVLVCAITVMTLVGGAFSAVQKAMLIFWLILMHLKSAHSITEMLFALASGVFMVWYAFSK